MPVGFQWHSTGHFINSTDLQWNTTGKLVKNIRRNVVEFHPLIFTRVISGQVISTRNPVFGLC